MGKNSALLKQLKRDLDYDLSQRTYTDYYVACFDLNSDQFLLRCTNVVDNGCFDLASITKALVTTPLVLALLDNLKLSVNCTIATLLTKVKPQYLERLPKVLQLVSIEDLLRHRSGLPAWQNFYVCKLNQHISIEHLLIEPARQELISTVLDRCNIDSDWIGKDRYSDVGMILLGLILEWSHEMRLDKLFASMLSGLGTTKIGYRTNLTDVGFVPTGYCNIRERQLCGEVWDENAAALGGVAGHCGLFGTGDATVDLIRKLIATNIGRQLLHMQRPTRDPLTSYVVGWRQADDYSSEVFANGIAIGHMGFTGTAFWFDTTTNRLVVFLTNRVISGRVNPRFRDIRRRVFQILNECN